jgi:hypothetical protein
LGFHHAACHNHHITTPPPMKKTKLTNTFIEEILFFFFLTFFDEDNKPRPQLQNEFVSVEKTSSHPNPTYRPEPNSNCQHQVYLMA